MAAKPKGKKTEVILSVSNQWDGVTVGQKKDEIATNQTPSWAVEDLLRVQKELDHEQYLHRLTKRENDKLIAKVSLFSSHNDKLIAKRKSTCIEIKRLREQNQSLKRELEQALLTVADLSRSFWQRLRTMGKKAR